MALIHGNQADAWQGSEERAAWPNDDFKQARAGTPPGVIAFAIGKLGMDQSYLAGEARQETSHGLCQYTSRLCCGMLLLRQWKGRLCPRPEPG